MKVIFTLTWCFFCYSIWAQSDIQVKGIVINSKGYPISGATILVKGKDRKIKTIVADSVGEFNISVTETPSTLTVSAIGYKTTDKKFTDRLMYITLLDDQNALKDVVVIGYQGVTRRNLSGSVSTVNGKDLQNIPEMSLDQMLQGKAAGVSVLSSSGEAGKKANIVIRGSANVNYGGSDPSPLFVIDGVIFDVNNISDSYGNYAGDGATNPLTLINPNDIESIDILKDASAAAIYGSRAGNGVIIIKTKHPKRGKPQLNLSSYYGILSHPQFQKTYIGADERRLKVNQIYGNLSRTNIENGAIPIQLTDSLNEAYNNAIDWQGLVLRPNGSLIDNEDFSVGQVSNLGSFRFSLNHYNETGLINGYDASRISPALDLNFSPIPKVNFAISFRTSMEKRGHGSGLGIGSLAYNSFKPSSFFRLNQSQIDAITGSTKSKLDDDHSFSYIGSFGFTDTISRTLLFNSYFSYSDYISKWDYYSPVEVNNSANYASSNSNSNPSWNFENYITYNKTFGLNNIVVVAGVSGSHVKNYSTNTNAQGSTVSGVYTVTGVPNGPNLYGGSNIQEKSMASYYSRVSYVFNNRYILGASIRRDASSIYSNGYKWATFPAASAAWIVSDEKFFKHLRASVNFFKIRASYGLTGYDPGDYYAKYQTISNYAGYSGSTTGIISRDLYGNYFLSGNIITYNNRTVIGLGNNAGSLGTQIHWVKNPQLDLGVNLNLFNDRISIDADYYVRDTKGQYFGGGIAANPVTGYTNYGGNLMNIRNVGWEITLNTKNLSSRSKFQWNTSFNFSHNDNYITKLPNGGRDLQFGPSYLPNYLSVGRQIFAFQVMQVAGVYNTVKDIPIDPISGKQLTYYGGALYPGDPIRVDQNGDYNIDDKDLVLVEKAAQPAIIGGFTNSFYYKNFSLDIYTTFVTGRTIRNGSLSDIINFASNWQGAGTSAGIAGYADLLNQFWQKPGDVTIFPKLIRDNYSSDPWNANMSYWLEQGWFVKIKNVRVGYSLPQKWTEKLKIANISVYSVIENLYIFKDKNTIAPDPELADYSTGDYYNGYPSSIKINFGISVNL